MNHTPQLCSSSSSSTHSRGALFTGFGLQPHILSATMAEQAENAIKQVVEGVRAVTVGADKPRKDKKDKKEKKAKQPAEEGAGRTLEVGSV